MKMKRCLSLLLVLSLLCLSLTGCGNGRQPGPGPMPGGDDRPGPVPGGNDRPGPGGNGGTVVLGDSFPAYESLPGEDPIFRAPAAVDTSKAVSVSLEGSSASAKGNGVSIEGGTVTVTKGGTYVFRGVLDDGRIVVDAPDGDVVLVFAGADVTCNSGSPLYVHDADEMVLHLMEGTENFLTDSASYSFDDEWSSSADGEPDACLFCREDLVIQGFGGLTVRANYKNGITCKDDLEILDGSVEVEAVKHGINGKDSLVIDSARVTVKAGGDGLRSSNDKEADKGNVTVRNSAIWIISGEDAIQGEHAVTLGKGAYQIETGGGSRAAASEDSAKGIKGGTSVTVTGGNYLLECRDDAIHCDGDVVLEGGSFSISSGDDAVHADGSLILNGGRFVIGSCYEGLEAVDLVINGGEAAIRSRDDGLNAAGGNDGSGFGGTSSSTGSLTVNGGTLYVVADGDGLDANGPVVMTGGTVTVFNAGGGNGALDYDTSFTLTGGVLLACGVGSMDTAPSDVSQHTVFLGFGRTVPAGSFLEFRGGGRSFVYYVPAGVSTAVFSAPALSAGETWTVSCGGSYGGSCDFGVGSGGVYEGGSLLAEVTLSSLMTRQGVGGMGGRP